MPSSTIRRQMKNMVNNYSDAEKKVREATSNDPWGPSSSLMSEVADLTYNVVAFSEIMSMIWKRLNDHGKNWRHVYKALTLLDYLIKTGSERVALQCKENIFAIQTLKDFQYIDRDGKDQGINVREKSKQLVVLLKDDERLKGERSQALKTKERMAQVSTGSGQVGFGRGSSQPNLSTSYSEEYGQRSEGSPASYHGSTSLNAGSELEQARPQTSGEEELQLQLALVMSREAARAERRSRIGKAAQEEERAAVRSDGPDERPGAQGHRRPLGGRSRGRRTGGPVAVLRVCTQAGPPRGPVGHRCLCPAHEERRSLGIQLPSCRRPLGPRSLPPSGFQHSFDLFNASNGDGGVASILSQASLASSGSLDLFDPLPGSMSMSGIGNPTRKTPESFLGPNAALVNLDSLVTKPAQPAPVVNPFLASTGLSAPAAAAHANPFQVSQPAPPTLNQMRVSPMPSGFGLVEPMAVPSVPAQPVAMAPRACPGWGRPP
uniref:Epsin 2 n=1 Tax=Gasterosteus aculeatus aculeatus TaxID=481459 RepID=A0AAQ4NSA0_GASAC